MAPSLIPRRPGERRKHDHKDAEELARLYRAGELVTIRVPTEREERVRDVVRCREAFQREALKSRHYILKFLARRGLVYREGQNWTGKHMTWLRAIRRDAVLEPEDQVVFGEYLALLDYKLDRREELDRQIETLALEPGYKEAVGRLGCLKGISTQAAMVLVTEIGDFRRFEHPGKLMAYVGLVPSEHSSGGSRRQGSITKADNAGVNQETGEITIEIKGLVEPKSDAAARICREDLDEVIAAFMQDKVAVERGLFDKDLVPEELTQVRMGKIVKEKFPELDEGDQEAVREHAVGALNLHQEAKQTVLEDQEDGEGAESARNTALIDGVRRFMDVQDLDIDLIDRINPFGAAYAILAKAMNEGSLRQVHAVITAKKVRITPDEARDLARRALRFKQERGRLPSITSADPWEKRMAEGVAVLQRMSQEADVA